MYLVLINWKIQNRGHCNKTTSLEWASVCFIVNESYLFSFDYVIVVWQCGPHTTRAGLQVQVAMLFLNWKIALECLKNKCDIGVQIRCNFTSPFQAELMGWCTVLSDILRWYMPSSEHFYPDDSKTNRPPLTQMWISNQSVVRSILHSAGL